MGSIVALRAFCEFDGFGEPAWLGVRHYLNHLPVGTLCLQPRIHPASSVPSSHPIPSLHSPLLLRCFHSLIGSELCLYIATALLQRFVTIRRRRSAGGSAAQSIELLLRMRLTVACAVCSNRRISAHRFRPQSCLDGYQGKLSFGSASAALHMPGHNHVPKIEVCAP